MEPRERDLWLDKAERGQWTRAKLRQEMRDARGIEPGLMDDLVVTGKSGESPHDDLHEEPSFGGPAVVPTGDLLGDPVSGLDTLHQCPSCGHVF